MSRKRFDFSIQPDLIKRCRVFVGGRGMSDLIERLLYGWVENAENERKSNRCKKPDSKG